MLEILEALRQGVRALASFDEIPSKADLHAICGYFFMHLDAAEVAYKDLVTQTETPPEENEVTNV